MAHIVRPFVHLTRWHRQYRYRPIYNNLFAPLPLSSTANGHHRLLTTEIPLYHRSVNFRPRGLRSPNAPQISEVTVSADSDSDSTEKKSRNEKKREARRAVRWAMDIAAFSPNQIKRILRVALLEEEVFSEQEVFDAIMLVKRLGGDVREGKRRQFSYIGRLLREVQPDLMDGLIEATKDGDLSKFQNLYGAEIGIRKDDTEEETDSGDEVEDPEDCINTASRWFDGLINKDINISNEIYSVHTVEFDRQELRRLVRDIYTLQEHEVTSQENDGKADKALLAAKKSLTRFLRAIAKQLPSE